MEAFSGIHTEQNKLLGEIDYTYQKVRFYNSFDSKTSVSNSYTF
jgi:hypothetical protein